MEVNELQFKLLRKQLEDLQSYLTRVHQYHLGAKPSFMYRNHWNEINDALHNSTQKATVCCATAQRIEAYRADIPGRLSNIRETFGKASDVGNSE